MMEDFSDRLIFLMNESDETQASLGSKLGVSGSTVSRWQSGSMPHKSKKHALASALGVTTSWLLEGKGEREPINKGAVTQILEEPCMNYTASNPRDPLLAVLESCAVHLPAAQLLEVISYLQERPELKAHDLVKRMLEIARSKI